MSKQDFKEQHIIDLQGKDYLPVAPRVVIFRADHPDYQIVTQAVMVKNAAGEDVPHMKAQIFNPEGRTAGIALSTAHKRINYEGKGPIKKFPVEAAETGAIGRALGLIGYGTLGGDLDEGEDIAEAPVERVDLKLWLEKISVCQTEAELKAMAGDVATLDIGVRQKRLVNEAWAAKRKELK